MYMKKTAQLRGLLAQYQTLLPVEEYESFSREVDRLLLHYFEILNAFNPGAERAKKTQELIEEQIAKNSHIQTSCQKGCGACCHLEVEITEDDAALMALSITANNLPYNQDSLIKQAQRDRLDPLWAQGAVKTNRCVMLGADNACGNYENRPSVCRKHSVVSPAQDCETIGASPVPRLIPLNEIILSAAINLPQNNFGSLPKLLNQALEKINNVNNVHTLDFVGEELVKTVTPLVSPHESDLELPYQN
jgi:Fe-S-cluster containining protein